MADRLVVDPEFRELIPPLSKAEREGLEQDLIDHGNRDPIVVWRGTGSPVLVDGHNRRDICKAKGIALKKPVDLPAEWSRDDVKLWIIRNQLNRRNLSLNKRAYLIGKQYLAAAPGQGARTDMGYGESASVRLAKEFNITDGAVRQFGKFVEAVDILTNTLGVGMEARARILDQEVPFSREDIRTIAALPTPEERVEVWEKALKDRSSLKIILQSKKRHDTKRAGAAQVKTPTVSAAAEAMARYALPDLVRVLATNWGPDRLGEYAPGYGEQTTLQNHMAGALRSLIWVATQWGYGEEALDEYRTEQGESPEEEDQEAATD